MHALADHAILVVAVAGAVAVFVVTRTALASASSIGDSATVLAACTAVLAFFGLRAFGVWLLVGAGLLAAACVAILIIQWLPGRPPIDARLRDQVRGLTYVESASIEEAAHGPSPNVFGPPAGGVYSTPGPSASPPAGKAKTSAKGQPVFQNPIIPLEPFPNSPDLKTAVPARPKKRASR